LLSTREYLPLSLLTISISSPVVFSFNIDELLNFLINAF
jgi:hypothetical protein